MSKILLLDIETSPNTAHVWGIWQQNIAINQLLESSQILCFAAKWLGEKDIVFKSIKNGSYKAMLKSIWKLLDEADAVAFEIADAKDSVLSLPALCTIRIKGILYYYY
jgi:hypothetical protein